MKFPRFILVMLADIISTSTIPFRLLEVSEPSPLTFLMHVLMFNAIRFYLLLSFSLSQPNLASHHFLAQHLLIYKRGAIFKTIP